VREFVDASSCDFLSVGLFIIASLFKDERWKFLSQKNTELIASQNM